MKLCDILGGQKHTLTPPTYFQGVKTPNSQDLRPCTLRHCRRIKRCVCDSCGHFIVKLTYGYFPSLSWYLLPLSKDGWLSLGDFDGY